MLTCWKIMSINLFQIAGVFGAPKRGASSKNGCATDAMHIWPARPSCRSFFNLNVPVAYFLAS